MTTEEADDVTISGAYLRGLHGQLEATERERDGAYTERARLVAFLATLWRSVVVPAPNEEYWVVYIASPAGQLSWHIHPRDAHLLRDIPYVAKAEWDGHTTDEKYERLAGLSGWSDWLVEAFAGRVAELAAPYEQIVLGLSHVDANSPELAAVHAYYEGVHEATCAVRGVPEPFERYTPEPQADGTSPWS